MGSGPERQMKPRVLIVDDEEAIRFFAIESLTAAGWDVYEADSGEAALQVLAKTPCGIVFLDLRMEGMDGLETMREIKNRWPDTSIIIMTAYASLDSAIQAVRQGAFDYLRKPCSSRDILACANRVLAQQAELDQKQKISDIVETTTASQPGQKISSLRPIQTGHLLIDLAGRRVFLTGDPVSLTPTEYELLHILARTPGRPVSLEKLVVEGLNYSPTDKQAKETLRVHISRLRQKVGSNYILTVRGGGYALAYLPPETLSNHTAKRQED